MPRNPTAPKFTRLTSEDRRAQLIDVGLACLARGGIQEFTVDKICLAAGVSRGLILHHFGSMGGLLAAVYAHLYRETTPDVASLNPPEARLSALIDGVFAPRAFGRDVLNSWVALWGQIANTPALRDSIVGSIGSILVMSPTRLPHWPPSEAAMFRPKRSPRR